MGDKGANKEMQENANRSFSKQVTIAAQEYDSQYHGSEIPNLGCYKTCNFDMMIIQAFVSVAMFDFLIGFYEVVACFSRQALSFPTLQFLVSPLLLFIFFKNGGLYDPIQLSDPSRPRKMKGEGKTRVQ